MKLRSLKTTIFIIISILLISGCKSLPGGDATKNPPNPKERVAKILKKEQSNVTIILEQILVCEFK